MSEVNTQLFMWLRLVFSFGLVHFFMHFEVQCCNNTQKLWLTLTFQSAVLKQLVVGYGFVSNNNMKYIATAYWLIAKSTGYPFLK